MARDDEASATNVYWSPFSMLSPRFRCRCFLQAVEHSPVVEMPEARRIVDYGVHREGEEPACWIWGRADYEDIFGEPHFVEWCYQPRFDAHDGKTLRVTFIQWVEYNRTDDPE
jgi:hypothetical protein